METFMMPIGGKSILRSTGEEVEIIDSQFGENGGSMTVNGASYEGLLFLERFG